MKNAIVLCSGGLDSVVTAFYVREKLNYGKIVILFFDYGQRALEREGECARMCAEMLGAEFKKIKLSGLSGLLVDGSEAVELSEKDLKDTKKEGGKWYMPQRNLIFLSYALSFAESVGGADIFVGFENEGQEHYPDTTSEFVEKVNQLAEGSVKVIAPFIEKDKEDIISIGGKFGVDFTKTFSCYVGLEKHCGKCLACKLRMAGFKWSEIEDPTDYGG